MNALPKTANFIATSCEIGAIVAKLSAKEVDALREYGYCIGMAFQIVDDILDLTSDSKKSANLLETIFCKV